MPLSVLNVSPSNVEKSTQSSLMKITLVIYALDGGGAQRVMSIFANYWAASGWDVTLILLVDDSELPFYQLAPQIQLQQLGIIGDSPNALNLLRTTIFLQRMANPMSSSVF